MVFTDGRVKEHYRQRLWWMALDLYVTAKCLWNPDLDREALLEDFFTRGFGPAAPAMRALYTRAEDVWLRGDHGGRNFYCSTDAQGLGAMREQSFMWADPWKCLFTRPVLDELVGHLSAARKAAGDGPYRPRVELVGEGVEFALERAAKGVLARRK